MGIGMIANPMAGIKSFLDQLFAILCILPNYKKGRFDPGVLEDL